MTKLICNACEDGVQVCAGFLRKACNVCDGQGVIRLSREQMIALAVQEKELLKGKQSVNK